MRLIILLFFILKINFGFSQTPDSNNEKYNASELFEKASYYSRIQDSASFINLEKLAHHFDKRVAESALYHLGKTKNEKALSILYKLALDSNFNHRAYAVEAITYTESKNACLVLSDLKNHSGTEDIHEDILKAVGKITCLNFESTLLKYQKTRTHPLYKVSSEGLREMGSLKFFDRLVDQLEIDSLFEESMHNLIYMHSFRRTSFSQRKDDIREALSINSIDNFSKGEIDRLIKAIQSHFEKEDIKEYVKPENIIYIGKRKDCLFVKVGYFMHGYNLFIYPPRNNFIKGISSWVN